MRVRAVSCDDSPSYVTRQGAWQHSFAFGPRYAAKCGGGGGAVRRDGSLARMCAWPGGIGCVCAWAGLDVVSAVGGVVTRPRWFRYMQDPPTHYSFRSAAFGGPLIIMEVRASLGRLIAGLID